MLIKYLFFEVFFIKLLASDFLRTNYKHSEVLLLTYFLHILFPLLLTQWCECVHYLHLAPPTISSFISDIFPYLPLTELLVGYQILLELTSIKNVKYLVTCGHEVQGEIRDFQIVYCSLCSHVSSLHHVML